MNRYVRTAIPAALVLLFLYLVWASMHAAFSDQRAKQEETKALWGHKDVRVIVDPMSGCNYVVFSKGSTGGAAITPRLREDGSVYCYKGIPVENTDETRDRAWDSRNPRRD